MNKKIILASKSTSRQQILKNAEIPFEFFDSNLDERSFDSKIKRLEPAEQSMFLSKQKALKANQDYKALEANLMEDEVYFIGCDQILSLGKKILHKVSTIEDAYERLRELSGKIHYLYSSYAISYKNKIISQHTEKVCLKMVDFDEVFFRNYLIKEKNALLSVGCYQIEKRGITLFDEIKGDYFSILGLPLLSLLKDLRDLKII